MIAASHAPCDVLLVRLSAMGDVVHALGAMHALALVRPQWRLHVAVQSTFAPLFDHLDWLASVVPHRRHPPLRGFAHFARAARALRCSLALDLQGNWKSALAAFASGAPRRVGIAGPLRRERHSACLLTDKVAPSAPVPHPAHLALDVVRAVAPEAVATSSLLVATDEEMAREAAALRALGIDAELPFLVLVLGDPRDNRSWPAAEAERAAAASTWPALTVLGPDEPEGLPLPRGIPVLRHRAGELRRLVALGALLARCGGRALGPDQGPTHVLAACGADVIALFGPQDPARTAPLRARVLVRRDGPSCVPCRRRVCDHRAGPVCMQFGPDTGVAP